MPVIGPHADIEAELLLAKRKPIGGPFLVVNISELPKATSRSMLKAALDRIKLDEAVKTGELFSLDLEINRRVLRYYCQGDRYECLKSALDGEQYVYGEEFGYRPRDIRFFEWYVNLPDRLAAIVRSLNSPIQNAYINTALRDAGIDNPKRYWEDVRRRLDEYEKRGMSERLEL